MKITNKYSTHQTKKKSASRFSQNVFPMKMIVAIMLLIINGAIALNGTTTSKSPDYWRDYITKPGCDNGVESNCKNRVLAAFCQGVGVPLDDAHLTRECCLSFVLNATYECVMQIMLNDAKLPCKKNQGVVDRANQVDGYCVSKVI